MATTAISKARTTHRLWVAGAVLAASAVVWAVAHDFDGEARLWLDACSLSAAMGTGGTVLTWASWATRPTHALYGLGALAWAVGDIAWAAGGGRGAGPLATWSAVVSVASLVAAMACLVGAVAAARRYTLADVAMAGVVALVFAWLGLAEVRGPGGAPLGWQPYLEVTALGALAFLLWGGLRSSTRPDIVLLAAGAFVSVAAETAYSLWQATGQYSVGSPIEVGWLVGPVLMIAAMVFRNRPKAGCQPVEPKGLAWALGPFLAMASLLMTGTGRSGTWRALIGAVAGVMAVRAWQQARTLDHRVAQRTRAMHDLAYRDPVAGIANRRWFAEMTRRALEQTSGLVAAIFVDLDDFKAINDTLGHAYGDMAVEAVASAISRAVRRGDIVARMGGDEYAVFLPQLDSPTEARRVAERVLDAVHEVRLGPNVLGLAHVRASVGLTVRDAQSTTLDNLLQEADLAMYDAKAKGDRVALFRAELAEAQAKRAVLDASLGRAFEAGELSLHYQPIVGLDRLTLGAVEALARWLGPDGRPLARAEEIVSSVERTGLARSFTPWVLSKALAQASRWGIPVAVNLSAWDLHEGLVDIVEDALVATGAQPRLLMVELTEDRLVEPSRQTLWVLGSLRKRGVRVSLDDFGTGYSSLSALAVLPVDQVKLDRSFLLQAEHNSRNLLVIGALARLADQLGLKVVAEGIETPEQWARLEALGISFGQGYLFSPPVPALELDAVVRERRLHMPPIGRPPEPELGAPIVPARLDAPTWPARP